MDIAEILRHILIVLVAAKIAAEVAERVGVPAVVGEILAGLLIGPSMLNAVGGNDEVLRTLGEIGVILLLLDVGMEMDLRELGKVGKTSLLVATIGVIAPMLLGIGAMELMGEEFKTALFVGAALTATSVGITARVFGDLRALATTEARIVLGAAVADDVMGLVVLTVVVRLVTEGSVSVLAVGGIVAVAVLFLVGGGLAGLRVAPPLFNVIDKVSRSTGTLVAIALAFTLGFAELADAAKLAPIVGAFVAGIALSQTRQTHRIRRDLAPVGHLFIPVFFLQIGIDADIGAFFKGSVLIDAGLLLIVAVIGKLLSPIGAIGAEGDKVLIGLGMLPRGEVGLIFATLGLQNGVLGDDLYAALLLVVLVTTLVTPQLLKMRYANLQRLKAPTSTPADTPAPAGGWLVVSSDVVDLAGRPPDEVVVPLALEAATLLARRRPGQPLLDWITDAAPTASWSADATGSLLDVIERGNARSWRFLEQSGLLEHVLPDLAEAFRSRGRDEVSLDPLDSHRLQSMERLRMLDADDPLSTEIGRVENVDSLFLATFLADALDDTPDPEGTGRALLSRLALPDGIRAGATDLLTDRNLFWSAAHRPGAFAEQPVRQLAAHLATPDQARTLYVLSSLRGADRERWELERLRQLHDLVQATLRDDALAGGDARDLAEEVRRHAVGRLAARPGAVQRVEQAPRAYLLATSGDIVAAHALLLDPAPALSPRVAVEQRGGAWWVDVAWQDHAGLLAAITQALAAAGVSVEEAILATWPDGAVLDAFKLVGSGPLESEPLAEAIQAAASAPIVALPLPDAEVSFDGDASPWHTTCEVRATDRPGVLGSLAAAFAATGIEVRAATATALDGLVIDRFEVTDRAGEKISPERAERFKRIVVHGATIRRRRFGRRLSVKTPP